MSIFFDEKEQRYVEMEVINIRKAGLKKKGYQDLEDWLKDPKHVYIGRNMSFYVKGANQSKWANPFSVKKYGREKCLQLYREHIINHPKLISELNELEGKILGCWCTPEGCHGDVLVDLIKETNRKSQVKTLKFKKLDQ